MPGDQSLEEERDPDWNPPKRRRRAISYPDLQCPEQISPIGEEPTEIKTRDRKKQEPKKEGKPMKQKEEEKKNNLGTKTEEWNEEVADYQYGMAQAKALARAAVERSKNAK